jgi:DNA polymerase
MTALDNPNSVQQMKQWLSDNGLETDSLGKKVVAELIKTAPPELQTVLELRQQLAKSSVKKYQTMERAVCDDGRARGMFAFYGANRTGRWAGRLIQLQNLPQNHLPDLADARALVKSGDFDAVKLLYEDVPDTLSQLIRTAFIPKDGTQFYVSDFSAIEARVIAWYAGETWRQKSLKPEVTSTAPVPVRCSMFRLRSMALTAICVKRAKLRNSRSATAARSEP